MKIPHLYLLLIPSALKYLGGFLNVLVMAANGGEMPVLYPGGCDPLHLLYLRVCMTSATRFKYLADWMVINHVGVISPGDFLIWTGTAMIVPALVAWAVLMSHEHQR